MYEILQQRNQELANRNQVFFDPVANQYYTNQYEPTFFESRAEDYRSDNPEAMNAYNKQQMQLRDARNYMGALAPLPSLTRNSVASNLVANRQPFQYNAPSLQSLFGGMQAPQGMQGMQGNPYQGMFSGGLLGGMPTPVSSTTTQAPASSGAGRFL